MHHALRKVQPIERVSVPLPPLVRDAQVDVVLKAAMREPVVVAKRGQLVDQRVDVRAVPRHVRGIHSTKQLRPQPLEWHDAVLDAHGRILDRRDADMTAIAVQQLQRMQTRAQVAMRHVAKHRESTRVRRQMLPRTNLTQASRNERRRRAVAAHDLRHRAQRAQSRRIQVVADAHDRTQDRLALLAARRACPTLQEADERAHKARRAQRIAAARRSIDLVNHHERRTPMPTQAVRLERRAHAALYVGRRTCIARIQLVHTIAGVLCHHMRQRRLPQARRTG